MTLPWCLYVLGCGTVGYSGALRLACSRIVPALSRLVLVDPAKIKEHNAITCPKYVGHVGRFKCERLADLIRQWKPSLSVNAVETHVTSVERLDWQQLLSTDESGSTSRRFVLAGLDSWPSRLNLAEDLRLHAAQAATAAKVLTIQLGLDRAQAQVCVYGDRFEDACPACGLGGALPTSEPCVVLSARSGEPLRGDLQREARAAVRLVEQIISDELGVASKPKSWAGTKVNLVLAGAERTVFSRPCRHVEGCLGPHGNVPIRWDRVLPPLREVGANEGDK